MKTLIEIYTDIISELKTQFNVLSVGKSLDTFAQVHAVSLYLFIKEQAEIQKNFTPQTAYSEALGGTLEAFGRRVLGREPTPATQGEYVVNITGSIGGIVLAGTTLRNSNNDLYEVQSNVTLIATTGTVDVKSLDSGTDYELIGGQELFFTIPIASINSDAIVASVTTSPIAAETESEYKQKIVERELIEGQGGSAADYRLWGFNADGVVGIYAYTGNTPGEINVYVEANTSDGVPTATILSDVEDVIELNPDTTLANRGRRPLGGFNVFVQSISPINIDIDIANLSDSSATVITTIESAVTDFLKTVRPQVDGADDPNKRKDVLSLGDINTVVRNSLAIGNTYDNITLSVASVEVSTYQFALGNIPKINSVNAI